MSPSPSTIGAPAPRRAAPFALTLALALGGAPRAAAPAETDSTAPPNTALVLSARCVAGGNSYAYFRFARTEFLIEPGEVLEYSVYVDGSSPLPRGGVDILCAGGATLRDSGATDEDGRSAHGDADLSAATDRWITRRIPLAPLAGRVAQRFVIGCEGDVPGTYVQYVDDVAVTNAAGERRVLFGDGWPDTVEPESSKGYDTVFSGIAVAPRRESYERGRVPILLLSAEAPEEARKHGPRFRTVDLGPWRDRRGVADAENPGAADFDGAGNAFPAGELPTEPTILSGVPFDLPPALAAADHVSAHGQVIDLAGLAPGATFLASFLAASRSSTFETPVVFVDEAGAATSVPLAVPAWTDPEPGTPGFDFSHRAAGSGRVLGPTRLAILTVPVALATPARALKLPETPDLRIFSITLRPLGPHEIDDEFRIGFIAHTVRTPESADYLRNYRFARLLPEFEAEEGRLRRLYDLAVAANPSEFRSTLLERLTRFTEAGARHKALTSRVTAWLDLSRPPRTGAPEAVERATDLLRLLSASDDVTCAIAGVAAIDAIAGSNPQLWAEMKRLALARRLEFASVAWALPRPNRAGGETLVRNLLEGQRFLGARLGATGRVAALLAENDVPPTLPQILRKSGVDYAVFLPATGERAVPEKIRSGALGRWEGTDGSRVFAVSPAGHPEGGIAAETLLDAAIAVERRHGSKDALILFGAGAEAERALASVRDAEASRLLPKVRFDRVESYCDAIASQRDVEPPVTRGDPFPEAPESSGGPAPRWGALSRARYAEAALVAAESLRATFDQDETGDLEALWRTLVVTIAGDPAESDLAPPEADARAALASALARVAAAADTSGAGAALVVVNPLGFEREESVEIPLGSGDERRRVVDEAGTEIPSQAALGGAGDRAFVSVAVPPFSWRVLRVVPEGSDGAAPPPPPVLAGGGAAAADAFRLENPFVRVTLDPVSGRIASLFDKASGRETLGGAAGGPAGTILVAGTGGAGETVRLASASVIEPGPVRAVVALEFATASGPALRQTVSIEAASPRVRVEIDWTGRPKGASAAMKIPVAGAGPFATVVEAPFGAAERAFPLPGSAWIDVAEASGPGILALAMKGASIGLADAGAIAVTADERAEFALVPHGAPGGWVAAQPARHAAALLVPLALVAENAHAGARAAAPFLAISGGSGGAFVEGLRRSADGTATVVRLRETHGAPAEALLRFGAAVGEAIEADLLERPTGRAFPAQGADVPVGLAPFEIQTILVRKAK